MFYSWSRSLLRDKRLNIAYSGAMSDLTYNNPLYGTRISSVGDDGEELFAEDGQGEELNAELKLD